ncbi:hypothetical protein KSS87_001001, partial [Heliosperma pusillum]
KAHLPYIFSLSPNSHPQTLLISLPQSAPILSTTQITIFNLSPPSFTSSNSPFSPSPSFSSVSYPGRHRHHRLLQLVIREIEEQQSDIFVLVVLLIRVQQTRG